jgi:hypothetical protein
VLLLLPLLLPSRVPSLLLLCWLLYLAALLLL